MGFFDIFKTEQPKTLGTLHGMDLREWNDGYKSDDKKIIKFINDKISSMSYEEFLNFLKNKENYRKFLDEVANDRFNKIYITDPKGDSSKFLPNIGFVLYPRIFLNPKEKEIPIGYKIADNNFMYDGEKMVEGNFKTLIIISFDKNEDWWAERVNSKKKIRSVGFQFVDLDEEEYNLIKDSEKTIRKNDTNLLKAWGDIHINLHKGIFVTEKRKKYPINRFQTYLAFEE